MTQWEFDTIIKTLEIGTPVLYETLGNSLNNLVIERNTFAKENEELKAKVAKLEEGSKDASENSQPKKPTTSKTSVKG